MKKLITTFLTALLLSMGFSQLSLVATADDTKYDLETGTFPVTDILDLNDENNDGTDDQEQHYFQDPKPLTAFIVKIIEVATTVMGTIGMIILIIGGFMMMFAQGNQQKVDEAKDIVKYAIIGLVVAFFSYIIVLSVQSIFLTPPQ
jgi:hypothetical protein